MFEALTDKAPLRKKMIEQRLRLSADQQRQAEQDLLSQFKQHIIIQKHDIVAGYMPIRHEVSPVAILENLQKQAIQTALPVMDDPQASLTFKLWELSDQLEVEPRFSIRQPLLAAQAVEPTILLIPLVAFDQTGHRLGYGSGFYDRTISRLREQGKTCRFIGIAYDFQQIEAVPVDVWDQKLDAVLTNRQFYTWF